MMTFAKFISLGAIVAYGLLSSTPARAVIETYSFVGMITAGDVTGPLTAFLGPNLPVSGAISFDLATPPTTPGNWDLTTAQFSVDFNGLNLTATGATASVGVNQDIFVFHIDIPPAEFLPVSVTSATVSLGFQTFTDGFFSLTSLPIGVPPNDHTLGISYVSGGDTFGASTDTNIVVTSALVPEPASITLFGAGLLAVALRRRFRC
jgi:hypothetical protein